MQVHTSRGTRRIEFSVDHDRTDWTHLRYECPPLLPQTHLRYECPPLLPQTHLRYECPPLLPQTHLRYECPLPQTHLRYECPPLLPQTHLRYECPPLLPQTHLRYECPPLLPQTHLRYECPPLLPQTHLRYECPPLLPQTHLRRCRMLRRKLWTGNQQSNKNCSAAEPPGGSGAGVGEDLDSRGNSLSCRLPEAGGDALMATGGAKSSWSKTLNLFAKAFRLPHCPKPLRATTIQGSDRTGVELTLTPRWSQ
ncbi:uncharacterized protein LOC129409343 [Boleophthalmus pectinirostris]|uniref:uncharacterized protein LOC129409343 n=1 Tax=Boleophthalmus pectinirostris TaxID=150288 RepID=UPI00242C65EA|nr:uncharacterized protein LOC129409343 [Boleophthalmus pectinirostris]